MNVFGYQGNYTQNSKIAKTKSLLLAYHSLLSSLIWLMFTLCPKHWITQLSKMLMPHVKKGAWYSNSKSAQGSVPMADICKRCALLWRCKCRPRVVFLQAMWLVNSTQPSTNHKAIIMFHVMRAKYALLKIANYLLVIHFIYQIIIFLSPANVCFKNWSIGYYDPFAITWLNTWGKSLSFWLTLSS